MSNVEATSSPLAWHSDWREELVPTREARHRNHVVAFGTVLTLSTGAVHVHSKRIVEVAAIGVTTRLSTGAAYETTSVSSRHRSCANTAHWVAEGAVYDTTGVSPDNILAIGTVFRVAKGARTCRK